MCGGGGSVWGGAVIVSEMTHRACVLIATEAGGDGRGPGQHHCTAVGERVQK